MKVKKADRNEWIHCINSSVKNQHNQKTAKLICIVFFWNYKHIVADIPWIIAANFHQIYSHIILHKQKLIWFRNVDSCDLKKSFFLEWAILFRRRVCQQTHQCIPDYNENGRREILSIAYYIPSKFLCIQSSSLFLYFSSVIQWNMG